jgi:hypothetical protein
MTIPPQSDETGRTFERLRRFLHENSTAVLRYGELYHGLKYVLDEAGDPLAPASPAFFEAGDTVFHVPDEESGSLDLLVTPEEVDPECAAADRWRVYHGQASEPCFAKYYIEAAKKDEFVIDGEALREPNPLAGDEPAVCRMVNRAHVDALRAICQMKCHVEVEQPILVGIDPYGFDVRARFGIVRITFEDQMRDLRQVRLQFDALAGCAGVSFNWESST